MVYNSTRLHKEGSSEKATEKLEASIACNHHLLERGQEMSEKIRCDVCKTDEWGATAYFVNGRYYCSHEHYLIGERENDKERNKRLEQRELFV